MKQQFYPWFLHANRLEYVDSSEKEKKSKFKSFYFWEFLVRITWYQIRFFWIFLYWSNSYNGFVGSGHGGNAESGISFQDFQPCGFGFAAGAADNARIAVYYDDIGNSNWNSFFIWFFSLTLNNVGFIIIARRT